MTAPAPTADMSLQGRLRRRLARIGARRPAAHAPPRGMVSFSFDDIPASAAQAGARVLEARGLRGTFYVCAGLAGRPGPVEPYADREAITTLARAGHEIGCHTHAHLNLATAERAPVEADLARNAEALEGWGVGAPETFAFPFGDVSAAAKRIVAPRFALCRALHPGLVARGTDLNQAPAIGIEGEAGVARASDWIARAAATNRWLILYSHSVLDRVTPWGCTADGLDRLAAQALAAGLDVVTVAEGARRVHPRQLGAGSP